MRLAGAARNSLLDHTDVRVRTVPSLLRHLPADAGGGNPSSQVSGRSQPARAPDKARRGDYRTVYRIDGRSRSSPFVEFEAQRATNTRVLGEARVDELD